VSANEMKEQCRKQLYLETSAHDSC